MDTIYNFDEGYCIDFSCMLREYATKSFLKTLELDEDVSKYETAAGLVIPIPNVDLGILSKSFEKINKLNGSLIITQESKIALILKGTITHIPKEQFAKLSTKELEQLKKTYEAKFLEIKQKYYSDETRYDAMLKISLDLLKTELSFRKLSKSELKQLNDYTDAVEFWDYETVNNFIDSQNLSIKKESETQSVLLHLLRGSPIKKGYGKCYSTYRVILETNGLRNSFLERYHWKSYDTLIQKGYAVKSIIDGNEYLVLSEQLKSAVKDFKRNHTK